MQQGFKEWLVTERARALAMVLLTRRDDLVIQEAREDLGLDFLVYLVREEDASKRPFGVLLRSAMSPVSKQSANNILKPTLASLRGIGPFPYPVCILFFTMKNDSGYYTWGVEPVVTKKGEPKLHIIEEANCQPLDNEALDEIISRVDAWYDSYYAHLTD